MTQDDCKQLFALLSEYVDGELPRDVRERIDRHIGECPPCVQFLESLRKSTELCRSLKSSGASAPMPDQARAELRTAWRKMLAASGT